MHVICGQLAHYREKHIPCHRVYTGECGVFAEDGVAAVCV